MTLRISKVFTYDEDAGNYIQAVEAADGQVLEGATRKAINNFVIGCKQDGIWSAIKASCILAGARTLGGALVPLVGTAPTRFGTEGGWNYNRKTGLQGNGNNNYLNTNRSNAADPQNNNHNSVFASTLSEGALMGDDGNGSDGTNQIIRGSGLFFVRNRGNTLNAGKTAVSGFMGVSRNSSSFFTARNGSSSDATNATSASPDLANMLVFRRYAGSALPYSGRIAFYSIGESLDLALLDARVTDLINAIGAAIP